jgi:hypothetical protein
MNHHQQVTTYAHQCFLQRVYYISAEVLGSRELPTEEHYFRALRGGKLSEKQVVSCVTQSSVNAAELPCGRAVVRLAWSEEYQIIPPLTNGAI